MGDGSWEVITYARQLVSTDSYSKAFDLFLQAFEKDPGIVASHEAEFRGILLRLNNVLATSNKMDIVFDNFSRALKVYPNNVHLLNDIGKYLYKYGFYREAWDHFQKVLKITPNFVNAEKNLNSIKNLMVERWHYRMLNDNIRNESYRNAIHQTITTNEERVLDVGTGTGLLAIYASEKGAKNVIGCDGSEVMSQMAKNIVRLNRVRNVKVENKMSMALNLWNMGGKCTILLTEMFDAGLFGEHILQMLSHAWPNLLTSNATVVPNSAEFFVAAGQSDHLNRKYQLCSEAKTLLNIPSLNVHILTPHDETYDCEDVHLIKDLKYITESKSVLKINFNDLQDITDNLERTEPYKVELNVKENGVINTVIGWFNLYLSDTVTITTNPEANDRANAWQQAVFFDDVPTTVLENQMVNLEFLINGGKLTLAPSSKKNITRVSPDMIRFLNDTEYIKMITGCISLACVYLGQMADISQISIVDLCPFPLFGMLMLKRGAQSLLCCAQNDYDKDFIIQVFNDNQISMSKVTMVYGDDWTPDIFRDEKYHAICTHFLDLCGDVDLRLKEIAVHLRQCHLIQGGLFMPAQVRLVAQLVSSRWLDLNNRLYDENVSNYMMEMHVNKYKVTQNFCIDLSVLKYVPISEPVVVCSYPNGLRYELALAPVINNGYANAILCWYSIELMEDLKEVSTNRPHSLIDGMLFLTYPTDELVAGATARIIQHKDTDGCFKLVMESV